jgi:hypothetical protein
MEEEGMTAKKLTPRQKRQTPYRIDPTRWLYADGKTVDFYYEHGPKFSVPTRRLLTALRQRGLV